MNNLWTEKYRPIHFEDTLINYENKKNMINWLTKIKNGNIKQNCLFLYGPPGIGKTTIATLLLKKFDYDIIEYNASDLRNQKILKENLDKINGNVNVVDFMCNKKKKIGLIIDELDGITSTDKGALKELISIINNSTDKSSPFICISNTVSKKFDSLKKKSLFVKINKPTINDITKIANRINTSEKLNINSDDLKLLILHSQNDIRRLISIMEYYSIYYNPNSTMVDILETIDKKNIDYSINDYSDKLLNKYEFEISDNIDKNMVSYYLYENFIKYIIKNRDEPKKKKINTIAEIYTYFEEADIIEKFIYLNKDFDLYDYYYIYKCSIPSYIINNMNKFVFNKVNTLDYSKLINKTSLEYLNNKYLNIIKFNFLNYSSSNNIISICDLLYVYIYKKPNPKIINYYIKNNFISYELLIKLLKYSSFYSKDTKLTIKYLKTVCES